MLRDLHAAGVPLFALTNWSDELFPQALDRFDFLGLFEDIVVSGAEGVAKPDPAIFERARASGSAGRSSELRVRRRPRRQRRRGRRRPAWTRSGSPATAPLRPQLRGARPAGLRLPARGSPRGRASAARSTSSSETPSRSASKAALPPRIPKSRLVQSR